MAPSSRSAPSMFKITHARRSITPEETGRPQELWGRPLKKSMHLQKNDKNNLF